MRGISVSRGFTLLEVLVAVALSALLAVLAYSALTSAFSAAEQVESARLRLDEVDSALQLLERDLSQLVAKPVATPVGWEGEVVGDGSPEVEPFVRFTRLGWRNPLNRPRSDLQRVEYRFSEGALWRWHWPNLSDTTLEEPYRLELFNGIEEMQLRFLDRDSGGSNSDLGGSWRDVWDRQGKLPEAVEITLQLEDMGEIRRLLPLPAGI